MPVKILITGDVVPHMEQSVSINVTEDTIFKVIRPFINEADLAIANLEAPVVYDNPTPIKKSGPCLYTSDNTIVGLKRVGFNVVTLANNHFFDQGQNGVNNTLDSCYRNGVRTVGGGKCIKEARKPLYYDVKGKTIAIINACEHEFSIADAYHGGSNPLDLINMQEDIMNCSKNADYVILILHGGIEQYQYPTPRMKRWYHHFIDLGADAVINHHQHCICGYEVYHDKPIFYGLGNFYFPTLNNVKLPKTWYYGYAVRLSLDYTIHFELIPYKQSVNEISLVDKESFDREIEVLNLPINDDFLLQEKLDEHILANEYSLSYILMPSILHNRFFSALFCRGYFGRFYKGKHVFSLKNLLSCEAHYEKIKRLFTIYTK